jgi:CDP-glucose 4,6-dehydratase
VELGARPLEDVVSVAPTASLGAAYADRRVLVTGHTGFKGAWLTLWLARLGARVTGFALPPPTRPSLFEAAAVRGSCEHVEGDVRDGTALEATVRRCAPEIVFHLAAQALVRRSYEDPVETIETNVLGTARLLEALRSTRTRCAVVVVTSDKCYENRETDRPYEETDPLGGHDPYSASKGAAELVVTSWRRSFFPPERLWEHGVALATARAGNVIGGGDWSPDRLVPDAIRALAAGDPVLVRNPASVRPWQHVLEPLGGYLQLGAALARAGAADASRLASAWNFGPRPEDARPVRDLTDALVAAWGTGSWRQAPSRVEVHEAKLLRLDVEKARRELGWAPRWRLKDAVQRTAEWYRAWNAGATAAELSELCVRQIAEIVEA